MVQQQAGKRRWGKRRWGNRGRGNCRGRTHNEAAKLPGSSREILSIALPTTLSLAIEPLAALISTAFVGHLGATELAGVGAYQTHVN